MAGYTRQSSAGIVDGGIISADDLNDEFDKVETAMGVAGHSHSGDAGEGPQINSAGLASASVTNGKLASNAVTGNKIDSTTTITAASFVGPVTGNITGNITGNLDADSATIDSLTITSGTAVTSIDTDLSDASSADDTLASAKAIKTYVDALTNELAELTDVTISGTLADNEVVAYDTSTSKFINQTPSEAGLQPSDAGLTSIAGLTTAANEMVYTTGSDTYATTSLTAAGRAILDDADASAQRTTLGLAIGTDVQAYDAGLDDLGGLAVTDGNIIVGDGNNWVAESGSTARTSLGLTIGTDVQAYDAGLASIAGLTTAADKMIYTTASDVYAVASLTAAGLALLDDTSATAQRSTLGLGTMATADTATYATLADPTFTGTVEAADLTLSGDLTVNGTTTTLSTTNTLITDNLLELNSGATSNANDCGIIIERGSTGDNAVLLWDESGDQFAVGTTTDTADTTGNLTYSYAKFNSNEHGIYTTHSGSQDLAIYRTGTLGYGPRVDSKWINSNPVNGMQIFEWDYRTSGLAGFSDRTYASMNVIASDVSSNGTGAIKWYASKAGVTSIVQALSVDGSGIYAAGNAELSVTANRVSIRRELLIDGSDGSFTLGNKTVDIIRDEDTMSSNDDNALATQQSIKAYVDAQVSSTMYTLAVTAGTGDTRDVYLTAGTWQIIVTDTFADLTDGELNYTYLATRDTSVNSTTLVTSIRLHNNSSGKGRNQHGMDIATGTTVVATAGTFTLTIANQAVQVVAGGAAATEGMASQGCSVILEKIS